MSKYKKIFFPILSIVVAFIIGLFLLLISNDPLTKYKIGDLLWGNFRSKNAFLDFLGYFSVYGLVGIAVAIGFRGGIFNIGVSGQMMFAGVMSYIALSWGNADALNPFFVFIICILSAMALGLLTAVLKVYANIHEVVATIMLNWAALYFYQFVLESGPALETNGASIGFPNHLLINLNLKEIVTSPFNIGIFITIILIAGFWFIFKFTSLGYKIKISGSNPLATKYAGVKYNKIVIYTMLISSCVAGIAGFVYYYGMVRFLPVQSIPLNIGFDGITVALLANNSFIGIIFSALFVSAVYAQKVVMSGNKEIVETIIAIALLSIALGTYFLVKPKSKITKWYLQLMAARQLRLPYSYHGINKWYLKFLRFKDFIQLEIYYLLNKIDIYYEYFEAHTRNWLKLIFMRNRALYLSQKLLINVNKEMNIIEYWKEYEEISEQKINFAKQFFKEDKIKIKKLNSKENKIIGLTKKIILIKQKLILKMHNNNMTLVIDEYENSYEAKEKKILDLNKIINDSNLSLFQRWYYKLQLQKLTKSQLRNASQFISKKTLIEEITKEVKRDA